MVLRHETNIRSKAKCNLLGIAFNIPTNVRYSTDREGKKPNSFYKVIAMWIPKPDNTKKQKLLTDTAHELKTLANQIQQYMKRNMRHDQAGFIPDIQD